MLRWLDTHSDVILAILLGVLAGAVFCRACGVV
jgi:hypothetical protein